MSYPTHNPFPLLKSNHNSNLHSDYFFLYKFITQMLFLDWEDPLEEEIATHSSNLPGKSHGQRSLADYSTWGCRVRHTTEWQRLNLSTSLAILPSLPEVSLSLLKSLLNVLQYCCCFMFWFFGCEGCGILAPQPVIKLRPPAVEGQVLNIGPPGNSPYASFISGTILLLL